MLVFAIFLILLGTCHCKVEISDRASNFSVELLFHTAEETQWHTVISPLGVWYLLTSVSIGASGASRVQLRRGLFLPTKKDSFLREYKTFMESVVRPVTLDVTLKTQNYIFVDNSVTVKKIFEDVLKDYFKVKINRLPFSLKSEAAAQANKAFTSSGVIEYDVFEPNDFEDAKMILTNLMSFTGHWQSPFNASETHVEPFHDEAGNVIGQVNMMQQEGSFKFLNMRDIYGTVLRMPYGEDENYSFLVILPYSDFKLTDVYRALAKVSVKKILNQLNISYMRFGLTDVNVKLPRFKISTNVILNKPLQSMGVVNIFDSGQSSFRKISDSTDLYISAIVHKAEIRVTEFGTIASASSSAYLEKRALPSNFNANRPFLYFIIEESTATVIFSGVYSKPTLF